MKQFMKFMKEEDGMGVIEVVLIIIVLIGLASLFKKQVTSLVTSLLSKMTNATKDF
ncbi:Flp1 family type IVb pilin [Lachnospira multipara]|uniref:Flp1 family type IVb pilin n=1 Tax=Lachnospira multipara TaxID=28051 RepID=UPI0009DE3001|nr:Flp1 family type IVb pilin [Lachnospira multipara]